MEHKNRHKRVCQCLAGILVFLLGAILVLLVQLFPRPAEIPEVQGQPRYLYLAPNVDDAYFSELAMGMNAADQVIGSNTLLLRCNGGLESMKTYMEDALLADVDGIVVKASADLAEVIEKAVEQNVPVVFYDTDFPDTNRTVYIGIDNYQAGLSAMKHLVDWMGGQGKVLLVTRNARAGSQAPRLQGCQDALADYPQMEIADIIVNRGDELFYKEALLSKLREEPSIGGILCLDGVSADATGGILNDYSLTQNLTVGTLDLTGRTKRYLEDGTYQFVMMQDTFQIGYEAVLQLNEYQEALKQCSLAELQDSQKTVYIDLICVTKENLNQYRQEYHEELNWDVY